MKYLLVMFSLFFITACAKSFDDIARSYERATADIKEGDSQSYVVERFDRIQRKYQKRYPSRPMEVINLQDGRAADVYYMRTAYYPDNQVTDDELTPYIFVDGKLASIGWEALGGSKTAYDQDKVAEFEQKRTMEMARRRGMVDELE